MNDIEISKLISYVLRHVVLSQRTADGWIKIEHLISEVEKIDNNLKGLSSNDILRVVNNSSKKRHEIKNDQIRAFYGHSVYVRNNAESIIEPPPILYHGTTIENYSKIKIEGLKKMDRQFVHLTSNIIDARKVALRKKNEIIVLKIFARKAYLNGVVFYNENNVWLCEYLASKYFISIE